MTRIDSLSENVLFSRYKTIKQAFDQLKVADQATGSDSVRLQREVTGSSVDFHVHSTYQTINCWEVTYTANGEGIPDTGFVWQIFFDGFNGSGSGNYETYVELSSLTDTEWMYRFWVIGMTSGQTYDFDVRVVIYAMSQGSISISQIQ